MTNRIINIDFEKKQLDDSGIFSGYASNFGNIDSHNDIILPGAFGEIDNINTIDLLWQHDKNKPIGEIIELVEDDEGLFITAKLFLDNNSGITAYKMLKKGAVNGLSIGYKVLESCKDLAQTRYIESVELFEISLVSFPSNKRSRVIEVKDATDLYYLGSALDEALVVICD